MGFTNIYYNDTRSILYGDKTKQYKQIKFIYQQIHKRKM